MNSKLPVSAFFTLILLLLPITFLQASPQHNTKNRWPGTEPDSVRPAPRQIAYQRQEKIAFVHFGVNTFTNREWGTGKEDPSIFNPTEFDADQWARVLSETGFETLVLTAKHHDGFCLWPSKYTQHDVASSPWKNGKGDIVKEVAGACRKYGIKLGLYLSPWDMHEPVYGTPSYNEYYMNQLRELLTNYGPVAEVWFDGAKGKDAKDMQYDFEAWWNLVRELQPDAVIFSDEGPGVRWIGNEHGFAGKTNWSKINRDSVAIGRPGQGGYLNTGEPHGPDWVAGECNTSIRPGWFYHPEEDDEVKPVSRLMEIYYKSVGRNCTMMLNIPPDTTGRFHPNDVQRLYEFSETLNSIFTDNLASGQDITVDYPNVQYPSSNLVDGNWETFWIAHKSAGKPALTLTLAEPETFDHIVLQEYIPLGQRIASFTISAKTDDEWREIAKGTTVGYKRILRMEPVTTKQLRIVIDKSYGRPALSEIRLYRSR